MIGLVTTITTRDTLDRRHRCRAYRRMVRGFVAGVRASSRCLACGSAGPIEFHHVDPARKRDTVSALAGRRSLSAVLAELAKTVPLCRPCHQSAHAPDVPGQKVRAGVLVTPRPSDHPFYPCEESRNDAPRS